MSQNFSKVIDDNIRKKTERPNTEEHRVYKTFIPSHKIQRSGYRLSLTCQSVGHNGLTQPRYVQVRVSRTSLSYGTFQTQSDTMSLFLGFRTLIDKKDFFLEFSWNFKTMSAGLSHHLQIWQYYQLTTPSRTGKERIECYIVTCDLLSSMSPDSLSEV
jgi:hypothetical protein